MGSHASQRNGFLDSLRFLAALGIVLFHLEMPGQSIGLSALSFFTAILCYFAAQYSGDTSLEHQINRMNHRIMWPWLVWSVIYLTAKLLDAQLSGHSYSSELEHYMWWTGPALHLWYLPFAFTISLLITQLIAPINASTLLYGLLISTLIFLCMACGFGIYNDLIGIPWVQWLSVLPAALVGITLAAANRSTARTLVLVAAIVAGALIAYSLEYRSLALQLSVGGLVAMLAVLWNPGSNRLTFWLGTVSLGIYLSHPLCFALIRKISGQDGNWLTFVLTVVLSIVMAEAYRRTENAIRDLRRRRPTAALEQEG
jgi:peptidoglycan/LPS O-acetylase OafA/YrhL